MPQNTPSFEDDFDTEDFRRRNQIPFTLRRREFHARRLGIAQLKRFQAELGELRDSETEELEVINRFFRRVLPADEFAVFVEWMDDEDNPIRTDTVRALAEYISNQIKGNGDDPKGDDSSPSPTNTGTPSTTSSDESSASTSTGSTTNASSDSSSSTSSTDAMRLPEPT